MKKLTNFRIDEELMKQVSKAVLESNDVYKDKTQFVILAIQEKIKKETAKDESE